MLLAIPTNHVCDHIVQLKQEEMTKKDSDKGLCSLEVSLCYVDKICDVWFGSIVGKPEGIKSRRNMEITLAVKHSRISPEPFVVNDY